MPLHSYSPTEFSARSTANTKKKKDKPVASKTDTKKTTAQKSKPKSIVLTDEEKVASRYKVNGIAEGAGGYVAMINNGLVREGEQVDDITIIAISSDQVLVKYKDATYALYP